MNRPIPIVPSHLYDRLGYPTASEAAAWGSMRTPGWTWSRPRFPWVGTTASGKA